MDDSEVDEKDDIGYGKGKNEKDAYMEMSDDEKRRYLENKSDELQKELEEKRKEQIAAIEAMDDKEREKIFDESSTNADIIKSQAAIYALNNAELYKTIDGLKEKIH